MSGGIGTIPETSSAQFWIFFHLFQIVARLIRRLAMLAYTRTLDVPSVQYLTAQTRHARREDRTSQDRLRPGAVPGEALAWSIDGGPRPDYVASFKAFKKATGASERAGAKLGVHILAGVSPEWVREAGDLHDPNNPRNGELLRAAIAWANTWSNGGCYAARIDLDETGGAVVDLLIAPTAEQRHKSGKSKLTVSVNKALEALSMQHTGKRSRQYSALNTSWAAFATANLDPRLRRGTAKEETGVEHVEPGRYREMMKEAQAARDAAQKAEAEAREAIRRADEQAARLGGALDALEGLAEEIEAGTLFQRQDGKLGARNVARLRSGGAVVLKVATALVGVMREVMELRRDLKAAIEGGLIVSGREAEAEELSKRHARVAGIRGLGDPRIVDSIRHGSAAPEELCQEGPAGP